jgi:hypothetical protein
LREIVPAKKQSAKKIVWRWRNIRTGTTYSDANRAFVAAVGYDQADKMVLRGC